MGFVWCFKLTKAYRPIDSDPVGRGFDSLLARHLNQTFNFFPQTGFSQFGFPLGFSLAKPPADISDEENVTSMAQIIYSYDDSDDTWCWDDDLGAPVG